MGGGLVIRSGSEGCRSKGDGVAYHSTDRDYNRLPGRVNANRPGTVAVSCFLFRSSSERDGQLYAAVKNSPGAIILAPLATFASPLIFRTRPGHYSLSELWACLVAFSSPAYQDGARAMTGGSLPILAR